MVRGRCIVRSGVGFLGDVGPNAPVYTRNESAQCVAAAHVRFSRIGIVFTEWRQCAPQI